MAASDVPENVPVLVPPELLNTTVEPPVVRAFPAASRAVSVAVIEEPDATVAAESVIEEFASEIAPGVTVTVGRVLVIALPPMMAPIDVAVPATAPVNVAV